MNLLITGANGFVGRSFIKYLTDIQPEFQIFALIHSNPPAFKVKSNIRVIEFDITTKTDYELLPENIDAVIHLAQSSHYRDFPNKSVDIAKVNILGTVMLLQWAKKNADRFIFFSTGNVYDHSHRKPMKETDPLQPNTFYSKSKRSAEDFVFEFNDFLDVLNLRLFTIYGPGQSDSLISKMIHRISTKKKIKLNNGEGIYLSPIYIRDLNHILLRILELSPKKFPASEDLNIAGNQHLHLGSIVKKISKLLNTEPYIHSPEKPPEYLLGENEKLRNLIKNPIRYDFLEGLQNMEI